MSNDLKRAVNELVLGLQTSSAGSHIMAGFASRASFAGHADDGATDRLPLTFKPDHTMGAGQVGKTIHIGNG